MTANLWSTDRVTKLLYLWEQGLSGAEIAKAFDGLFTRNAIIGKLNRLGKRRETPVRPMLATKPVETRPFPYKAPSVKPTSSGWKRPPAPKAAPKPLPPQPPVDPRSITMEELTAKDCKWIVSGEGADALFCGARKDPERSYCGHHHAVAYYRPAKSTNELARSLRRFV